MIGSLPAGRTSLLLRRHKNAVNMHRAAVARPAPDVPGKKFA